MSYTNAVFYIDHASGSDAARTTLTGVVFSNPYGDTVLGTYSAHGLINGAVIDVTKCTQAYANSAWKVTKVNDDTFTLDDASWASFNGADVTGDAVPRGGSSWADAWRTMSIGASSARIAAGDVIRIAKTPDPVSMAVNGTWTTTTKAGGGDKDYKSITSSTNTTPIRIRATAHGLDTGDFVRINGHTTNYSANGVWKITKYDDNYFDLDGSVGVGTGGATGGITPCNTEVVQLATAQTKKIDDCEGGWSASGSSTVSHPSGPAPGYAVKVVKSSPKNDTLYAYKETGTLDLSAYTGITLWVYVDTAIDATTRWKVCLCSDTAGATIVDTFLLSPMSTARWYPLILTKDGGGNLGSSIKSIALYSGSAAATTSGIQLDNINACTATGFGLGDLVSKNSSAVGGTEPWCNLVGIYDTNLLLGSDYYGTTSTETTYYRRTQVITVREIVNNSGSAGNLIQYLGGYNTSTSEQDGETYLDAVGYNIAVFYGSSQNYWKVDRISPVRGGGGGIVLYHGAGEVEIGSINDCIGCSTGFNVSQQGSKFTMALLRRTFGCSTGVNLNANEFSITEIGACISGQDGININGAAGQTAGTITTIGNLCNNSQSGIDIIGVLHGNLAIGTIAKASYNRMEGVCFTGSKFVCIGTVSEANYNRGHGIRFGATTSCSAMNEIEEVTDASYNTSNGIYGNAYSGDNYIGTVTTSNNGTAGINNDGNGVIYISKATCSDAVPTAVGTSNISQVAIGQYGSTASRWLRRQNNGVISDQVTGGQTEAWSYGGAGLCQYYDPSSQTSPLFDVFYVPCTAAQGIQIHFQAKKTSAEADCALMITISGCGITPVRRASVSLTDAWAEYTSSTVTPDTTGFLRVLVEVMDGSTTGDVGIDDIHYAAP